LTIDYERLKNWVIPDTRQTYSLRDTLFYALSVGVGADALDERQLGYVYEQNLTVVPTMATILAAPSGWMRDPGTGIHSVGTLAVETAFEMHAPIPVSGTVVGRSRVVDVIDRGADRGALIYTERQVSDDATGTLLFTSVATTLSKKDGGFGGPGGAAPRRHDMPQRAPDFSCDLPAADNAALLFRLHLRIDPHHPDQHADPALARSLGHRRPTMHGLNTLGMACHALLRTVCDYDAARLTAMSARFSALAFPGDILRTEIWRDGNVLSFQCGVPGSEKRVLSNGRAVLS
jgi:acyl dehydratase